MADTGLVCCMCGDVGFPDKLFRCRRCLSRFQHSNYNESSSEMGGGVCDWCRSEKLMKTHPRKATGDGGQIKLSDGGDGGGGHGGKPPSATAARPAGRRGARVLSTLTSLPHHRLKSPAVISAASANP
ncbi:hypothetical protein QJS10_CPB11g00337 [Acorus calamus]|uniref:PHD-type zinc finger plants domain-containing protein n=1 Tax=Acorus calamus TaxID=4465 RepID=A0AAV9DSZ1_ACOCL|nr:hypothetical protein QJS10_CPB11g00337 [Acorus calamus]